MTDDQLLANLTDAEAAAVTAMGEARGDRAEGGSSVEERIAVLLTLRNRLRLNPKHPAWGATIKDVCFKPSQYSCWRGDDPNRKTLIAYAQQLVSGVAMDHLDPLLRETLYLADGVIHGNLLDTTAGATHYYSPASMKPIGSMPTWAKGVAPCARVGGEVFFKGV